MHKHHKSNRKRKGFTLTELLVSLGILSIICVASFSIFSQGLSAWQQIMERTKMMEETRATFTTIANDLVSATVGRNPGLTYIDGTDTYGIKFIVKDQTVSTGSYTLDNDVLYFCTTNFHPSSFYPNTTLTMGNVGIIGEVEYQIMNLNSSGNYVPRVAADLADIRNNELVRNFQCPPDYKNMATSTIAGQPTPVGVSVISFNVELYVIGTGWEPTWTGAKTSTLPPAVKLTLGVRKNYKKYYDNLLTSNKDSRMYMDKYYFTMELPTRSR